MSIEHILHLERGGCGSRSRNGEGKGVNVEPHHLAFGARVWD